MDTNTAEERDRPIGEKSGRGLPRAADIPRHRLDIDYIALKGPGLLASLALHLCIVALAVFGLDWMMPALEPEPLVVDVTLEELEPPPEAEESETAPPPEEAMAEQAPPPESIVVETPGDDGAKLISANKTDDAVIRPDHMFFGGKLKQGNEVRWNLRALAAESYTLDDYLGNYKIRGEDRVIRILDGREKYGKLLLHDPQTDTLRTLTRFGDKIFTYGPTLEAEKPVVGSITFLPVKHRAESGDVEIPSRLLWLPEKPPMKFGEMIRFDEREVLVAQGLRGLLTTPPGDAPAPAVLWAADAGCRSHFAYRIVARELALNGVVMLSLDPPECPDPGEGVRPLVTAAHIRRGMDFLRNQPGVDSSRVGVWARNGALAPAMEICTGQPDAPAFLIAIQESVDQDALTPEQVGAPEETPSLWFLVGGAAWSERMRESLRGGDAEIHALEEPRGYDTRTDPDADIDRLKLLGPIYVREALRWLGIDRDGE
ncbi:MAG: alpha/beta hydrolase family protein [Oceanidesulfovibrio sp.]